MATVSEAVQQKALRYIMEGRIRPEIVGAPIESFLCHSDSSDAVYRSVVGPGWTMCSCPATVELCCHGVGSELLSTLRRIDPARYNHICARIRDRASREDNPIVVEELVLS